nr:ribonuclease H-like domain-containing protein [Tanacetum cinerariifolium]
MEQCYKVESPKFSKIVSISLKRKFCSESSLNQLNTARQTSSKAAVSVNIARSINTAYPRSTVNGAILASNIFNKAHSHVRRPFNKFTTNKNSTFNQKVNTVKGNVTTVGSKAVVSDKKGNKANAVKASACWIWRPKQKVLDHVSRHNGASMNFKRFDYGNPQQELKEKGVIDSGCSRHMTRNMSYLSEYEEIDGGYVAFRGDPKGGKITGKGKISTRKLDFKDVYFVKELKFNLLVSQKCVTKRTMFFTNTECVVLSPNFKLLDESQVLLRALRKINMDSVDLRNIAPLGGLTCLFAKATLDESNLWHRRLGHINFKTMNKLVRGNLVRGTRPNGMFDIDTLTMSMNYQPAFTGNQTNGNAEKDVRDQEEALRKQFEQESKRLFGQSEAGNTNNTNRLNTVSSPINAVSSSLTTVDPGREGTQRNEFESMFRQNKDVILPNADLPTDPFMPDLEDIVDTGIFSDAYDNEVEGKHAMGKKWVYINKKDERGIVVRNKARLVAQGFTQEEGIDYDEVFAPVARIEAIRLFLTYILFMRFIVHQMDVKSAFLYGTIEEEVYVCQPPSFEDPHYLDKAYKVEKALYGLHQALRACQDKYMADILKKFNFTSVKTTSTLIETKKALIKDEEVVDVDVYLYSLMIRSLMYLTASRPDIMFDVYACARFQVTPKVLHLHAVKRIFRYLKGQPKLGLWYPRDSPFDLGIFLDSDYAGASLDRKSTIGGCQFLRRRLISWQKPTESEGFEPIVDFLNANLIKSALTVNPTIYTSCIQQFWDSAKVKTVNEDVQIRALVDGKRIIFNEACIRRDLKLEDADGTACLPNDTIFEELARTGYGKITQKKKQKSKRKQRKETEVPHIEPQIKESIPTPSNDLLPSGKDRMQLSELMELCTKLSDRVLSLDKIKTNQAAEIEKLKKRVKKLKGKKKRTRRLKIIYKVGLSARIVFSNEKGLGDLENASKQGRIVEIDVDEDLSLIDETDATVDEKEVSTSDLVTTAIEVVTTAKEIVEERSKKTQAELTEGSCKRAGDELEEDLEVLRSIVKTIFKKTNPVNEMDNLLFQTLKTMFEHQVEDNIQKYQQETVKVHNWKRFDSCGVYCVTTQSVVYYLLVEKMYLFTRNILHQLWNDVRLQTTTKEKLARKNELKARGTLLIALPNEHQLKFNSYKTAKSLMEAIEKRFRGLDQIYDRLQKLISQLEIHRETISQEDLNLNLLRSLSSEWKTHTLIWRNKPDLETLSMDDLYNNLKIYEAKVMGAPKNQDIRNREAPRRTVPVEDATLNSLVSQWNFMPSKLDLVFADEHVFNVSVTSLPNIAKSEIKTSESKLKTISKPIIKDWSEMSQDVLTIGSTMRIHLLYQGEYSQWSERFMNYLEEQTDGEAIINSIKNGDQPLPRVTQVSIARTSSTKQPPLKDKSMWSDQEKKINRVARFLLIQGLPNDIYSFIDSNKTAKDLWDALARHMLGSEYGEQDRKAQNQGDVNGAMESKKKEFVITSDPLALVAEQTKKVDEKKIDMRKVKCYNYKKEGHFTKDCKKAKVKDYEYYKTKMLLAKKDKDEQVLLAEDYAWMESISDSD